ncbi:hypothetical protein CPB84DRAFT_1966014 [Gymnopilus junonius]|uniref:CFEM domain-containing protein n=1 Tax=Gymnopilus junonius TaxID=109634 RepID=A0A9P5TGV0_GYMJU|nr:hypothetical protein CPB84DRAFT_1966014 [Gymnopilus junonius]
MYFNIASVFLISAASAYASTLLDLKESTTDNLFQVPICALPCATNSTSTSACSFRDLQCLCSDPNYVSNTMNCIQSSCSADTQQRALSDVERLCLFAGATASISIPVSTSTLNGIPTTIYSFEGFFPTSTTTTTSTTSTSTTTSASATSTTSAASRGIVNNVLGLVATWAVILSFYV